MRILHSFNGERLRGPVAVGSLAALQDRDRSSSGWSCMTSPPFPKYHEFMRLVLETVADGEPHALKEVVGPMQAQSGLSSEQLAETIPSGQLKFRNRSLWAATDLRKAQALSTPKRGWVQLAERGRHLLSEPGPVTVARLQEFPGWQEAWGTAA